MAEIHLGNIDELVLDRLETRAAAHRQSVTDEIRMIIEEACETAPARLTMDEFLEVAAEIRAHTAARPQTDSAVLIREDRDR